MTALQELTLPPVRRNLNGRRKEKAKVARKVRIREMDPVEMCGKGTSVTELYRVEETLDRARIHHLVFFDRHGWYCEHGKQCGAVKDVQKFTRSKL
ncbi:MAG: hypothetical protein ACJ8AB_10600 [Gemmatimonadaceae bacterium]